MKSNMTSAPAGPRPKRAYRQGARAVAAEQTAERIMDAMFARMATSWYDEITLDLIASDADTTAQTVIRRFGNKEGLLEATWRHAAKHFEARRQTPPGDARAAVRMVVREYEKAGDIIMRLLAQEQRFPIMKAAADIGRAGHRAWVEATFADDLEGLAPADRLRCTDGLVMALDLYTWQVVRRDMGRSPGHVEQLMLDLIAGVLGRPLGGRNDLSKGATT